MKEKPDTMPLTFLSVIKPKPWQCTLPSTSYKPCCQDEKNWTGYGPFHSFWPSDPYWWLGYHSVRAVHCTVCKTDLIGHEYSTERVPDDLPPDPDTNPYGWLGFKLSLQDFDLWVTSLGH